MPGRPGTLAPPNVALEMMECGGMSVDPSEPTNPSGRLRWALPVALAAALALLFAAPDDWETGPARLEVRYLGEVAVSGPVLSRTMV